MTKSLFSFTYGGVVIAPFLQIGQELVEYGLDEAALRDHLGRLILSGYQFRGNLRHLLWAFFETCDENEINEIAGENWSLSRPELQALFGMEKTGGLHSDLVFDDAVITRKDCTLPIVGPGGRNTRSKQDPVTGSVMDGQVFTSESHFAPDEYVQFAGSGRILCQKGREEDICRALNFAAQWIPALGANKTAGYGRVVSVKVALGQELVLQSDMPLPLSEAYLLTITGDHPLLISPKQHSGNVMESLEYIPGDVLFGAISDWAQITGLEKMFKELSTHMRLLHAYPASEDATRRPTPERYDDFTEERNFLKNRDGRKPPLSASGLSYSPKKFARTRTAVAKGSLGPSNEQLFTHVALNPVNSEWRGKIIWTGPDDKREIFAAFVGKLQAGLPRLGKTAAPVSLAIGPASSHEIPNHDEVTVVLNSDAWITCATDPGDMQNAYQEYFTHFLGKGAQLTEFYAQQAMRVTPKFRMEGPWPVTLAGSVFKLKIDAGARKKLVDALLCGLQCAKDEPFDQTPFHPSNGYGEIEVT